MVEDTRIYSLSPPLNKAVMCHIYLHSIWEEAIGDYGTLSCCASCCWHTVKIIEVFFNYLCGVNGTESHRVFA